MKFSYFSLPRRSAAVLPWLDHLQICFDGRPVALVGPNGSGKTTALNSLFDFFRSNVSQRDGVVLRVNNTATGFFPFRSGYSSIWAYGVARGRNPMDDVEKAQRTLAAAAPKIDIFRPVSELSTGERKLMALAFACAASVQVLLVDEPFAHLHASTHALVGSWLVAAAQAGTQIVLTSHVPDSNFGEAICIELQRPQPRLMRLQEVWAAMLRLHETGQGTVRAAVATSQRFGFGSHPTISGKRHWTGLLEDAKTLEPGTTTVITGSNGSGKSSLLRTIGALRSPTRGILRYGSAQLFPSRLFCSRRREFVASSAYVLQSELAVHERLRHAVDRVAEAEELAAAFDRLTEGTPWRASFDVLSSGEKSVLLLVGALLPLRVAAFLDEPFATMAPEWQSYLFPATRRFFSNSNCIGAIAHHERYGSATFEHHIHLST